MNFPTILSAHFSPKRFQLKVRPSVLWACLSLAGLYGFHTPAIAEAIANVVSSEGTVIVAKPDGKARLIAIGSTLESGDTIRTERDSNAKLRFSDGSEVAVRPQSALAIQNYVFEPKRPEKDSFVMELLRGGMRQISGFLSKRNQDAYKLKSGTATIGIRGTDFTARVCQNDCISSASEKPGQLINSTALAAKVVDFRGTATALQRDGQKRQLAAGAPVYPDDLIETGVATYVALVFRDETRMVIPANSAVRLNSYSFEPGKPEKGNVLFEMLRGGLRIVTGLIGRTAPQQVKINAGTATIGIRGTAFDLACAAPALPNPEGGGGGSTSCGGGLYTVTRSGTISITTENGNTTLNNAGQTSYVAGANQPPMLIRFAPEFIESFGGPLPETLRLDLQDIFGPDGSNMQDLGLYVTVSDGKVVLMQVDKTLLLSMGESGFAASAGNLLQRLSHPPTILNNDLFQTQGSMGFRGCRM